MIGETRAAIFGVARRARRPSWTGVGRPRACPSAVAGIVIDLVAAVVTRRARACMVGHTSAAIFRVARRARRPSWAGI